MCAQKAEFFHEALGMESQFNASVRRLTRLKHNMVFMKLLYRETDLSVNDAAADTFCIEFQTCVQEENLILDKIYKADESGLY
jgi:hypothetical protein